jgi:hypothetical protein
VKVAEQGGQVGDTEIEVIRLVGYDDAQTVEIMAMAQISSRTASTKSS